MKYELTLTSGAETIVLHVPTTWDDVTLQQYIDWQCSEQPTVCCLAGITPPQLAALAWQDAEYLLHLLAFAAEVPTPPLSEGLTDPGAATYGQLVLANQHFEQNPGKPAIWYAPYLYALYRCREVYGRNDQGKEAAMREAILQAPVGRCLSEVLFMWAAWQISLSATLPTPPTSLIPPTTKTKPGWKSWGSGLGKRWLPMPSPAPGASVGPRSTPSMPIPSTANSA